MKVGILKTSPPDRNAVSGVTRYLEDVLPHLRSRGVEPVLFWTEGSGAGTVRVPYARPRGGWGAYRALAAPNRRLRDALADWLAGERPDVLHIHWSFRESLAALRDLPAGSPPVLVSLHTYEAICPRKTHVTIRGRACDALPGFVCIREGCRSPRKWLQHDLLARRLMNRYAGRAGGWLIHNDDLATRAAGFGLAPVYAIPLGVDVDCFTPGPHPRSPVLLYAGRLRPEKGVGVLARSLPRILDAVPEAEVRIAGEGPLEDELRRAVPRSHAHRVRFLGPLPRAELAIEYRSARLLVVPSTWKENFALVGLEAMASATPVVAPGLGGIRTWLRPGENGLGIEPGNPSALAEAAIRLLNDAALAERLGVAARRTAESMALSSHADALVRIYTEALRGGVTSPGSDRKLGA